MPILDAAIEKYESNTSVRTYQELCSTLIKEGYIDGRSYGYNGYNYYVRDNRLAKSRPR